MSHFHSDFEVKSSSKHYLLLWYFMMILLNLLLGYYFIDGFDNNNNALLAMCWMGNITIIFSLYTWIKLTNTLFSAYAVFLLSFYAFSFGQAFLKSLGLEYEGFNLYNLYTNRSLLISHYYSIIGINFMHLGALCALKKKNIKLLHKLHLNIQDTKIIKAVLIVAWPMFLISAPFYFQIVISYMVTAVKHGYMALYNYNITPENTSKTDNVFSMMKMYFVPSVFLLIIAYKEHKVMKNMLTIVILLAVFFNFAAGVRTDAAALLISFVFLYHNFIHPFKGKKAIFLLLGALSLLVLFNIVGQIRGDEGRNIAYFIEKSVEVVTKKNPVISTVGEMGGSMFPLLEIEKLVPDQFNYKYGETYLSALTAIFPSSLVEGLLPRVSLSNWLMLTLNMNYGPGFSLLAEGYYNFGWLGSVFMFVLGYIFSKLLNPNIISDRQAILKTVFVSVLLYFFMTASRSDSLLLVRYAIFYSLIPYVLINLLINSFNKGTEKKLTKLI